MIAAVSASVPPFERPVAACMTSAVLTVCPDTPVFEVAALMDEHRISCLPVTDLAGILCGIISRTDLVALGALQAGARRESPAMPLPRRKAGDIMTSRVVTVPVTSSVRTAAQAMASHAIHHVIVVDGPSVAGIVSAVDVAAIVRDSRVVAPLSSIMSSPAITVESQTTLGSAIELLSRVRVSGLIVTANERPIGTFTQNDALAARDLPRSTPLDAVYEPALLCLPEETPLYVAARQLAHHDVRRIVACARGAVVGVATSLDFVRYVAW
ncbi:MAG TPA: CBS domain-containing protein [Kofleriaceae bacterium]|jgi:CBS domain-containing protein